MKKIQSSSSNFLRTLRRRCVASLCLWSWYSVYFFVLKDCDKKFIKLKLKTHKMYVFLKSYFMQDL
jgi:hypothetical protein